MRSAIFCVILFSQLTVSGVLFVNIVSTGKAGDNVSE